MRTPIGWALAYPERPALPQVRRLDLFATAIAFERPDTETFRCLALAREAGKRAMLAEREAAEAGAGPRTVAGPIVLNAANEVAVAAFLDGRLSSSGSPRSSRRASTGSATQAVDLARRRVRLRRRGAARRPPRPSPASPERAANPPRRDAALTVDVTSNGYRGVR